MVRSSKMFAKEILLCFLIFAILHLSLAQRGSSNGNSGSRGNGGTSGNSGSRGSNSGSRGSNSGSRGSSSATRPRPNSNINEDDSDGPPCSVGGREGVCRHLSACLGTFEKLDELERASCDLDNDVKGVCCPTSNPRASGPIPVSTATARRRPADVPMPSISDNDVDISGRRVLQEVETDLDKLEAELSRRGLTVKPGSAGAFHLAFFGDKKVAQDIGHDGQVLLETAEELARKFSLNAVQSRSGLGKFNLSNSVVGRRCPRQPRCPMTKYRSFDGSCNNLMRPMWGKSFIAFNRFIEPDYADGVSKPRRASDGGALPSARAVSSAATPDKDIPNEQLTLATMQWAQFIDHDFSLAVVTRLRSGEGIKCCDQEILDNPKLRHPACFEIEIPRDDPFYAKFNQRCMEFVRTLPAPSPTCTLGPKETLNQLTSYIDASQVYGSTEEETRRLRSFQAGLLRGTRYNNADLLPRETNRSEECAERGTDLFCFMAGDERVNEQISLTAMHTVWFREHNRIAKKLAEFNPGWTDEIIFQEARRIVGAEIQHITYNEFLPILLGRDTMRNFRLLLRPRGFSDDYDPSVNPTIGNGFSSSAYRYGHTLVQGKVNLIEENGRVKESHNLHSTFFNPHLIYQGKVDGLIRGLASQPAQTFDRFVTTSLTNHLFQPPTAQFGLDLIALNIQRARDNGVPSYNKFREYCGFPAIKNFDELNQFMHPDTVRGFKKNYRHVDDIDIFPAGVAEKSLPFATLGPTFACIAAEQFRRLKVGDRFFYENGGMESSFSQRQLREIRKVSLARVFCDNSDNIRKMQPLALVQEKRWNPKVACNSRIIPRMNLEAWRNEPTWSSK